MTTTQTQKLWILGIAAATAVAISWSLTFAAHLSVLALLMLVPYILPVVHSLDSMARLWAFAAAPVIQFSPYGYILGGAWLRGWLRTGAIVLAAFHIVAIIVCYLIFTSHIDLYDSRPRTEAIMLMRVEFYKGGEGRLCGWIATPPHRRPFQGSTMAAGRDLPHDLTQFTIERALEIRDGFWGLLAHGASFASVPGRRLTRPGRALVRAHHVALVQVEVVVNRHYLAWQRGNATPLRPTLDAMYARWRALAEGERLTLEWPVHPLPSPPRQTPTVPVGAVVTRVARPNEERIGLTD